MQKDLKIGLVFGLVLAVSALLWLATRPSLSPIARMSRISWRGRPALDSRQHLTGVENEGKMPSPRQPPTITPQPELPDSTQYEQAEKIKPEKFHIVLKDQTLSAISYKYYGSAGKWQKIFDSNRKTIKDPNKLISGTKLIIPE